MAPGESSEAIPSPRPQRRKPVSNSAIQSSPLYGQEELITSPSKTNETHANDFDNGNSPMTPSKQLKTKGASVKKATQSTGAKSSTWDPHKQRKFEPEHGDEEDEKEAEKTQAENTFETNTRKRKIQTEKTKTIEDSQTKSKRRKTTNSVVNPDLDVESPPKKTEQGTKVSVEEGEDASPKKGKLKTKVKEEEIVDEDLEEEDRKKSKRKRKTKEEKEAEAMPLAARTQGLRMFFGAHVSCAKELRNATYLGVQNSVTNCVHIGGNAFAMLLKSQRKWENPPLQVEHRDQFKLFCTDHNHILPHGSYLVNLAQSDSEKATQAYNGFIDDLHRCESLGIRLYNFHPGSTGAHPRPTAIARIALALNRAHAATKTVVPLLETMAGAGNIIGSTFEDLRDIIALVDDKSRIGVCLDTCHVFAAGYDLRSPGAFKATLARFDKVIGLKYLRALHLNDSKAPFASHRDLHQNIGLGFLGLRAFHNVVNESCFENLPLVLETPIDSKDADGKDTEDKSVWAGEIKMLERMIGMDAEGQEFRAMEAELAERGKVEREKYQEAFERKVEKERKAVEKGQTRLKFGKGGKKKKGEESESDA